MTALQAVHAEPDAGAVNRLPLCGQADGRGRAAGAGHGENPLVLGVQIDHRSALQFGQVDDVRAQHSDLLVHGDNDLQRRVGNGVVRQQRQGISNGNAVVAAQGSTFCEHKLIVMGDVQPVLFHVQRAVHILFTHHVHMTLQNHGGMRFHAAGAVSKENHIVCPILNVPQAMLFGKIYQIIGYFLRIPGTMGDGANFLKIMKNSSRFQPRQSLRFHTDTPFHWMEFLTLILPQAPSKVYRNLSPENSKDYGKIRSPAHFYPSKRNFLSFCKSLLRISSSLMSMVSSSFRARSKLPTALGSWASVSTTMKTPRSMHSGIIFR